MTLLAFALFPLVLLLTIYSRIMSMLDYPRSQNQDIVCEQQIDPCFCVAHNPLSSYLGSTIVSKGCIRDTTYDYVHRRIQRSRFFSKRYMLTNSSFDALQYHLVPNIIWDEAFNCYNDTFLLLLIFVSQSDVKRRAMFREVFSRRQIIEGKRVQYLFVVAADPATPEELSLMTHENDLHHDILISKHVDDYRHLVLSVLDSFLWVRDHCREPVFVAKMDGDVFVHLGNLVGYLSSVRASEFYGGHSVRTMFVTTRQRDHMFSFPDGYPAWKRILLYNVGGAYVLSRDLVPYVSIGALYQDFIFVAEDSLVGKVLRDIRVPFAPEPIGYKFLTDVVLGDRLGEYNAWPKSIIFVHNLKDFDYLNRTYAHFRNEMYVNYF